jgi:predicted methyltransferase
MSLDITQRHDLTSLPSSAVTGRTGCEPAAVREEVETAGFVLDAESAVLANKDDPHSIKVFDPSIKGETDRFGYRFVRL